MKTLRLLSGGAARGLVEDLGPAFEADTGHAIDGVFGAVGAMADRLRSGEAADVLILTQALIAELEADGCLMPGSAADIGTVETAIAVRSGDPAPAIGDADALRAALLAADAIHFPDPLKATAGIHFAKVLRELGIWDELAGRLKPAPSGAEAMRALAQASGGRPIGCTQASEIIAEPGVMLAGVLPEGCALATTYTAAITKDAVAWAAAARLVGLLCGEAAGAYRKRAGFA
jgi:molybdate transport system substrate-binding protein